ncbi:MAG: hypothetical protein ACTSWE_05025 [Promethearchaeota archaeon]
MKHKNFYTPITINDDPTPTYYPINGGLFYLWLTLPFKNVFIADIGQLPFYLISLMVVFAIARKIGLDYKLSLMASISFGIIPNYLKEIEIAYSDIMMACFFLLAFYFLLILKDKFSWPIFSLSVVNLGLLLGTKTAGLPYAGVLVIYLFYLVIKHKGIKITCYIFPLVGSGLLIFGGYGYLRNFILTANPLYPLDFVIYGERILKGVMAHANYKAHWGFKDFNYKKLFFSEGLGAQFLLLIAPTTILAPILSLKRKKVNFIFSLPLILFLTFRYIIPQLWVRFLYPYLGIGIVVGYWFLNSLRIKPKIINYIFILFVLLSAAELAGHGELIAGLVLSMTLFGIFSILKKYHIRLRMNFLSAIGILIIITLILGEKKYLEYEYLRYFTDSPFPQDEALAWKYLNDITQEGANIAYVGRPLPFPLYGTRFKNNVFYISVNEKRPFLHSYKNSYYLWNDDYHTVHKVIRKSGNYRGNADYNIWLRNLKNKNTDYLFIYALQGISDFPIEDTWARSHPPDFKLIFSNNLVHIYKITK